jgi:uncharacterized membrane protein
MLQKLLYAGLVVSLPIVVLAHLAYTIVSVMKLFGY